MEFTFWFIVVIDILIIVLSFLDSVESAIKNELIKKIFKLTNTNEKSDDNKQNVSLITKILGIVISVVIVVVIFALVTSIFWVPVLLFFINSLRIALVSLMLILAVWSFLLVIIYKIIIPNYLVKEGAITVQSIHIIFFILMSIYIYFGPFFPLTNIIETVYYSSLNFGFSASVFISILIVGLMITNAYLFINGLYYLIDKSKQINRVRTKIIDILTIFTFGAFFALFYTVDNDWPFLDDSNSARFYETIDLFKMILAAVLVPLILSRFANNKNNNLSQIQPGWDNINSI